MLRTAATLGATISVMALVAGGPAVLGSTAWAADAAANAWDISAAAKKNPVRAAPAGGNAVRATPQFRPQRAVSQPQFRQLGGSNTNQGGNKFHKNSNQPNLGNPVVSPAKLPVVSPAKLPVISPAKFPVVSPAKLPLGPGKINPVALKPSNFPVVKLSNKVVPIWKSQKKIWWAGKWKVFVPFTAIGVVLIGGSYFYPDGYLSLARPYCSGLTPDGCQLNWQMVNFEDGGGDWQCVQFCQRPGVMPPPQAVALVAPPPAQGNCQVTIFAEPNFGGTGVPTSEEQPALSQSGWQNQIASIQVQAGTWDFYTDENYTGETMRLPPGPYPTLTPEWTKHISSFMCSQGG